MPVRLPPVTENASRVLLESIIDYAGLFPPASVPLAQAVRNYAHYRASGAGWMLGRFICPAAALEEFSEAGDPFLPRDAGAIPWRLSAIGSGDPAADTREIARFNERHRVCFDECGAIVDSYEVRVGSVQEIHDVSGAFSPELAVYLEVPSSGDPAPLVAAIASAHRFAKIRTGGITPEAFPTSAEVARLLACCNTHEVRCKATAGLHHALRGNYPLTYDEHSGHSRMFGFLNVFLAAALLAAGAPEIDAIAMLEESDWSTIDLNDLQVGWRGPERSHVLDRVLLSQVRQFVITSFGSCSFTEPVDEARALGLL